MIYHTLIITRNLSIWQRGVREALHSHRWGKWFLHHFAISGSLWLVVNISFLNVVTYPCQIIVNMCSQKFEEVSMFRSNAGPICHIYSARCILLEPSSFSPRWWYLPKTTVIMVTLYSVSLVPTWKWNGKIVQRIGENVHDHKYNISRINRSIDAIPTGRTVEVCFDPRSPGDNVFTRCVVCVCVCVCVTMFVRTI